MTTKYWLSWTTYIGILKRSANYLWFHGTAIKLGDSNFDFQSINHRWKVAPKESPRSWRITTRDRFAGGDWRFDRFSILPNFADFSHISPKLHQYDKNDVFYRKNDNLSKFSTLSATKNWSFFDFGHPPSLRGHPLQIDPWLQSKLGVCFGEKYLLTTYPKTNPLLCNPSTEPYVPTYVTT